MRRGKKGEHAWEEFSVHQTDSRRRLRCGIPLPCSFQILADLGVVLDIVNYYDARKSIWTNHYLKLCVIPGHFSLNLTLNGLCISGIFNSTLPGITGESSIPVQLNLTPARSVRHTSRSAFPTVYLFSLLHYGVTPTNGPVDEGER